MKSLAIGSFVALGLMANVTLAEEATHAGPVRVSKLENIDQERYRSTVTRLASEEMEGRRVGTSGGLLAITFIETMFREAGLITADSLEGYRQHYVHDWDGKAQAANVVGILPGSHPELRREVVVVSAHHDGLGRNQHNGCPNDDEGRRIRYGANDNASGSGALIELAFALSARADEIARTVVFLSTDGEECGCTGVKHYVFDNPVLPIEDTVYNLNIDQIGEDAWLEEHQTTRREKDRADCMVDGEIFARRGVKAATLVGHNSNYHTPNDVIENIDFDEAVKVVERAYGLVWDAARDDSN